jgi:glycosyltransferase involved in cell wall biosynthesis
MRILIVTHYFPPEVGAPQARLSGLAKLWAAAGDEVTVLTGMPNHPTGVIPPAYRGKLRLEERVDGYRIVRTWVYATPNKGVVKKTLGHLSFMVTSCAVGAPRVGKVDVVVVSSPTFFSIFSAWLVARVRRAQFVVEVRDLWPAVFTDLGVITNRIIVRLLEALELAAYRAADAVVVVTEGFRDNLLERGVPGSKVHTVRNGADLERFPAAPGDHSRRRQWLGAGPDEVLVLYIGAHGISHGLPAVVDAADELRGEPVHVALVGDGAMKDEISCQVARLALTNVTLRSSVDPEEVPDVLAAADICLVPLRDVPLFRTFVPSKLFEYLAAKKAVIGSVRGETAGILRDAGAFVVEPEDPTALADAIRKLADDPAQRETMGERGRAYVAEHFDRRALADRYRALLESVVGGT